MTPLQIRNLRARRASLQDARWLVDTINLESRRFGFGVQVEEGNLPPTLVGPSIP
jgi:poly-gamma-glutamate capsule biosynthesis protein CapA/YwtB (metallophosphatase superfamily)